MTHQRFPSVAGVAGLLLSLATGTIHAANGSDPIINEFVLNHIGTDFNEYVEILGDPNRDYFNVWVLSIEGDSTGNPGTVDAAIRFGTSDANGVRTTGYESNTFENGTNTLLLVENFGGSKGDDLDSNNDGVLDEMPWDQDLDCVAVSDAADEDLVYCEVILNPGFDGNSFTVGGASRIPNGTDTGSAANWVRNDFDAEGIPSYNGSLDLATEALNTPAAQNSRNYASGGGNAPGGLQIFDIQGITHRTNFEGQSVTDVKGVVTAIDNSPSFARGFYMQTQTSDDDPRTSEGIFVLTGATKPEDLGVNIGSTVKVDGVVEENRPDANVENLTITRLRSNLDPVNQITILPGSTFIEPTIIGADGALPPTSTISSIQNGYIEEKAELKLSEGLDFYESFEGMLVEIPHAVAVSATSRFGEVWVVGDKGKFATGINTRCGITVQESTKHGKRRDNNDDDDDNDDSGETLKTDFNPERIQIDDGILSGAVPDVMVDDFLGNIIGILSYDFENFEVDTLNELDVSPGNLVKETTTLTGKGRKLTAATFNVENLNPSDGERFDALADTIVNNLQAPDILALQEVQDNNGATNDGTVAADETFGTLITTIEKVDPTLTGIYDFTQIDPENNQDGGQPGGNIRVGFLYRTDRVELAPGIPGNATTNTTVEPGPSLSRNPGRILDLHLEDGDAFASSRKPLVAQFIFNGQSIFAIANHFNSKGGDQPLYGPSQQPALISEVQRRKQAQIVNDFIDDLLKEDRKTRIVVLGDLNDFPFSEPLKILQGGRRQVLENLTQRLLPNEEQYTFIFDGNSQQLDHVLVSQALVKGAKVDIVHVNSEFVDAKQASDHDPIVSELLVTSPRGGDDDEEVDALLFLKKEDSCND